MIGPTPRAGSGPSASGITASGHAPRSAPLPRRLPNRLSRRAVCSPPWDVYGGGPKHARQLRSGGARPQKEPHSSGGSPAPAKLTGYQAPGPPANAGDPQPPAHPRAVEGGATAQPGPPAGYLGNPLGQQGTPEPQGDIVCPIFEPHAALGPQLPNPGRPRTVGPFQTIPGALATTCPAGRESLCPASPPLGGAIRQSRRPGPPPARGGRLHRHLRHLTEADQVALRAVMRSPVVCRTVGRRGRVTLLLKNPDQPVQEANLRGPQPSMPWRRLTTSGLLGPPVS